MTKKTRDIIYGVVLIVFAVANMFYANTIEQTAVKYLLASPGAYMDLWLILLALLALLMIIRAIKKNDTEKADPIMFKLVVITLALFVLYLLVIKHLGFILTSCVFVGTLSILYGIQRGGIKDWDTKQGKIKFVVKMLIFTVILVVVSDVLFREVLHVRLPSFSLW